MRFFSGWLVFFLLLASTGCGNVLYFSKLGWYQSTISLRSIPIEEILRDEKTEAATKEKIRFVQEVKRYGEERLGLKRTKSYSTFFETRGPILYMITACEKDRLRLYSWNFPIVGRMTYKSFFKPDEAFREKDLLERKGLDTFLQGVPAYSTLGWLRDPIFSPMLEWDKVTLAQVILHEMVHATVYFRGHTDFNEQLATFIGNQGAIHFLAERHGPKSDEVREAVNAQKDDLLFSRWVDQACQELATFYDRQISKEEKLEGRQVLFRSIREKFERMRREFNTEPFRNMDLPELNNAVLLAYRRYFYRLEKFEALYEDLGKDLKGVVELFKAIKASKEDPASFLERWMKERSITVPSSQR